MPHIYIHRISFQMPHIYIHRMPVYIHSHLKCLISTYELKCLLYTYELKCLLYTYTEQRSEWQGALLSGIWCGCRPLKCLISILSIYTEQRCEWQGALRAAVSLPDVRLCAFGARCWTRDVRGLEGAVYVHIYIY